MQESSFFQVERLEDRYGRCQEVDVFVHLTKEAVQELKDVGYVVSHSGAADTSPRVVIPPNNGNDGGMARLKECPGELVEKLYRNLG